MVITTPSPYIEEPHLKFPIHLPNFSPRRNQNEPAKKPLFMRLILMPCNAIRQKYKNLKYEPIFRISLICIQLKPVKRVRLGSAVTLTKIALLCNYWSLRKLQKTLRLRFLSIVNFFGPLRRPTNSPQNLPHQIVLQLQSHHTNSLPNRYNTFKK